MGPLAVATSALAAFTAFPYTQPRVWVVYRLRKGLKVVTCHECKNENVSVDDEGFMKLHRKPGRRAVCNGSGRHIKFNKSVLENAEYERSSGS